MKDSLTQLYPNAQVGEKVCEYAEKHSDPLPKHLLDQHAWASENHDRANYMISPLQAQFQIFMAKTLGAKRGESIPFRISTVRLSVVLLASELTEFVRPTLYFL
jgi:hypothetical protein